ncbi:hypothetical protein HanRHA438_Chr11g0520611 [Helianthus annuus]|nr:hypothetical protein HanRHA438_Chr11g0520611 [Helianthus annuus]
MFKSNRKVNDNLVWFLFFSNLAGIIQPFNGVRSRLMTILQPFNDNYSCSSVQAFAAVNAPLNGCVFAPVCCRVCSRKQLETRQQTAAFLNQFAAAFAAVNAPSYF